MTLLNVLATGLAILWLLIVVFGLIRMRRAAALAAGLTGITVTLPFLPRLIFYAYDRDEFVIKYGTAAVSEIGIGAVCVTLGLVALISAPLAVRFAWGWVVPALLTLFPVTLLVWAACCFAIRF